MKSKMKRLITTGCCLLAFGCVTDGLLGTELVAKEAEARRGRPRTPVSVAGAARRTTRRRIRRTTVYVATLPRGCTTITVEGVTLRKCGGTYYQASGTQYIVVTVD